MMSRAPQSKKKITELGDRFPSLQIDSSRTLFRSHRSCFAALYYCTCGYCRFDPPKNMRTEYGCCCTADTPEVALLEHLAGTKTVSTTWAADRRISEVTARRPHQIADIADTHLGAWGIGAEIQVGTNRRQTQSWGRAFRKAGFEGIRHRSRQANATEPSCVAFFGLPGERDDLLSCQRPSPIGWTLLRKVERKYGIQCFPPAPLFD